MIPSEIETATFRWFPDAFWEREIRGLFAAHRSSTELMNREYQRPEAENLLGFARRAKVEEYLRGTADLFPDMSWSVERPSGPWYHTEVRSGPMVLTASAVQAPGDMVDKADFRASLAVENDAQLFPEDEPVEDDHPLYAILVHSRFNSGDPQEAQRYAHLPGSAYLVFPTKGFSHYLHRINLFDRYPALVRTLEPNEWDEEAHVLYLHRARHVRTS
jgi:hypothetical protein